MDIKSVKYHKDDITNKNVVVITEYADGIISHVPIDLANSDYAEIMRQVDAGKLTIEEAE